MDNEQLLLTYRICKYNDKLLYMAEDAGYLLAIDENTYDVSVIAVPNCLGYRAFVVDNDDIIMFPTDKGKICRYNVLNNSYHYNEIPQTLHYESENNWSAYYIKNKQHLYFFWASPVITGYDYRNDKWEVYRDWAKDLEKCGLPFDAFSFGGYFVGHIGFFHIRNSRYIVEINTETGKQRLISIDSGDLFDEQEGTIQQIFRYKESIMVQTLSPEGLVSVYEGSLTGELKRKIGSIHVDAMSKKPFNVFFRLGEYIYLLPGDYTMAYKISVLSGDVQELNDIKISSKETKKIGRNPFDFAYGEIINGRWYGFNVKTNTLVIIDEKNGDIHCETLFTPQRKISVRKQLMRCFGSIVEDDDYGINEFVSHVAEV